MQEPTAKKLLGRLMAGTPGWKSADQLTVDIYTEELCDLSDSEVAEGAIHTLIRDWTSMARPKVADLRAAYFTEAARREVHRPKRPYEEKCLMCEGTLWIQADDVLHSGVRYSQVEPCPACANNYPAIAPPDPVISPAEGRKVARRAYADECRRRHVEPNWAYFNRIIADVGP